MPPRRPYIPIPQNRIPLLLLLFSPAISTRSTEHELPLPSPPPVTASHILVFAFVLCLSPSLRHSSRGAGRWLFLIIFFVIFYIFKIATIRYFARAYRTLRDQTFSSVFYRFYYTFEISWFVWTSCQCRRPKCSCCVHQAQYLFDNKETRTRITSWALLSSPIMLLKRNLGSALTIGLGIATVAAKSGTYNSLFLLFLLLQVSIFTGYQYFSMWLLFIVENRDF